MTRTKWMVFAALGATIAIAAYWAGRARAGVPSTTPLFYSGYLEDQNGAVNGTKSIVLRIYDDPNAGNQVCNPSPSGTTVVTAGRFRFALDSGCATAIHTGTPELWLQLEVDGQTLPRSKIGAVPFALEAGGVDWSNVKNVPTSWPGTIPWAQVVSPSPRPIYVAGGKSYSLNAGYCGVTPDSYTGSAVGGYSGAKSLCETTCGSPTAHMCQADELLRTVSTSGAISGAGWYNTGLYEDFTPGSARNDCSGWTTASSAFVGNIWGGASVSGATCDTTHQVLCCD